MPDRVTYDYESVTVTGSVVKLTPAKYLPSGEQHARAAKCSLESGDIRLRVDSNPSSSEGSLVENGDSFTVEGIEDIRRIGFTRTGAASGILKVRYER